MLLWQQPSCVRIAGGLLRSSQDRQSEYFHLSIRWSMDYSDVGPKATRQPVADKES